MRSLLELHYDDWHFQRWKAKRRGEFKVFNSIAQGVLFPLPASFLPLSLLLSSLLSSSHAKTAFPAHRQRLCTRLSLPKAVKEIFLRLQDEDDWNKIEQFRRALLRIVEGEDWLQIEPEEVGAIATALDGCTSGKFVDEVGKGSRLPEGARLQVGSPKAKEEVLAAVNEIGNGDRWLCYLSRPLGTIRAPLTDAFCKNLFTDRTAREIAGDMPAPDFFDRMLLCLFDALWLKQSEDWSNRGVSNMPSDEPYDVANWFLKGLNVGNRGAGRKKTLGRAEPGGMHIGVAIRCHSPR